MAMFSSQSSSLPMDSLSRILIIIASFFSIAALTLSIVGIATYSWYYYQYSNGTTVYYNLFTLCAGNANNGSSICTDMPRNTDLGVGTQHAAALLVVAICLLGCGMFVILAMNFMKLTGILMFVAPVLLFLATLFMVAALAEGSRVTLYNSYSANLVQTAHLLTIFTLGIIAFASGRLHLRHTGLF